MPRKTTPALPDDDVFAPFEFCSWADAIARRPYCVPLIGPDQRRWIAAAAAELRRFYADAEASERSRIARRKSRAKKNTEAN